MRNDVAEAILEANSTRKELLESLDDHERISLLEQLFEDFYISQHLTLQKWAALTGQSAQIDTGYMAQFIASIALGIPGQGFRGKGDDLIDGSEVKSAANISGVDRPRWNHNLGTVSQDTKRRQKNQPTVWEEYLGCPSIIYILVDRVTSESKERARDIRIRMWCIDAQKDSAWRDLIKTFVDNRNSSRYNFQLHPPVGYDDNLVVNTLGNLDFEQVLEFDARISIDAEVDRSTVRWKKRPEFPTLPISGRTVAKNYGEDPRPSNLTGSVDVVADINTIPALFPDVLTRFEQHKLLDAAHEEYDQSSNR